MKHNRLIIGEKTRSVRNNNLNKKTSNYPYNPNDLNNKTKILGRNGKLKKEIILSQVKESQKIKAKKLSKDDKKSPNFKMQINFNKASNQIKRGFNSDSILKNLTINQLKSNQNKAKISLELKNFTLTGKFLRMENKQYLKNTNTNDNHGISTKINTGSLNSEKVSLSAKQSKKKRSPITISSISRQKGVQDIDMHNYGKNFKLSKTEKKREELIKKISKKPNNTILLKPNLSRDSYNRANNYNLLITSDISSKEKNKEKKDSNDILEFVKYFFNTKRESFNNLIDLSYNKKNIKYDKKKNFENFEIVADSKRSNPIKMLIDKFNIENKDKKIQKTKSNIKKIETLITESIKYVSYEANKSHKKEKNIETNSVLLKSAKKDPKFYKDRFKSYTNKYTANKNDIKNMFNQYCNELTAKVTISS